MDSVLITGASGFVGSAVLARLLEARHFCPVPVFRNPHSGPAGSTAIRIDDLNGLRVEQLSTCSAVVHCAARVHVMHDKTTDPLAEYRKSNVEGTLSLARKALEAGVRRFVFVSSIKVNGEGTSLRSPYRPDDIPMPQDPYGVSKLEAERGLFALAKDTGMEVVIVRPPLVYGPGVKGNFASMIKLVEKGLPLPLGTVRNKRSLVGIDNLVDLLIRCIDHPAAANQVFLAGDGEDLSTTELLRGVAKAMGKPARLTPIPAGLLELGATLLGKKAMAQRLLGSLQVDISKTCELLDWKPPYTVEEGLRRCFERSN
ncbi:UDP-glucose 4-epimerase family protein [Stutzerimonas azotifigens]|uniref:UDP-glucose 4-epimerase family protein n=1 Tax=Stutzerimonas azotifigens TaxID=291995 RepID=UPI000A034F03|nr:SDR family oxidoreductase [Stutzerimonas azotifigens]